MHRFHPGRFLVPVLAALLLSAGTPSPAPALAGLDLEHEVGFPTGDWQLVEHADNVHKEQGFLFARKGKEIRKLGTTKELLALIPPPRNEVEVLALAAFLSSNSAYWSDFKCDAPRFAITPLAQDPKGPPPPAEDPDSVMLKDTGVRVDPYAVSVSRKGASGPFVVERYLRCPASTGRVMLVRETFGPGSRYAREELRAVGPEGAR